MSRPRDVSARHPDWTPPRTPCARSPVEHSRARRPALLAPSVIGEPPTELRVPIAHDQIRTAAMAACRAAFDVVHVAGVGVPNAVSERNPTRSREYCWRRGWPIAHLPVGMKGREMHGHVRAQMFHD